MGSNQALEMAKNINKKKNNSWMIWGLACVATALIGFAAYRGQNKPKGEKVEVEKVTKRTINETVAASGKVFPEMEVKISSDVSGEIVELHVEEGDSVRQGQLLAKIDPDAYQSAVSQGKANVNNSKAQVANSKAGIERSRAQVLQSKAQMEQVQATLSNIQAIYDRTKDLHAEGVISDAELEQADVNLRTAKANLRSAEAAVKTSEASMESAVQTVKAGEYSVKSAEARLEELNTNLKRTTIYAPTNGIISMLNVEQGERVVGTIQMAGTEMMRIANLNAMEVQVDVSENDVLRVDLNDDVEIEVDAYLGRKFKGKVTEIANSASNSAMGSLTSDQVTNFVVKVSVDAESYRDLISPTKRYPFRPGMSASVEIYTEKVENVVSVPIQAVTTREEEDEDEKEDSDDDIKEVIFVFTPADTVKMIEVKTGIQDDSYIQVTSGIDEDDEIIVGPYAAISRKLEEGDDIVKMTEEDKKKDKKKKS